MAAAEMPGFVAITLSRVFHLEGCPACRLKREAEERYATGLIMTNLNDAIVRLHIARSQGFCTRHSWALYRAERVRFGDALGNGVLYEELAQRTLADLRDLQRQLAVRPAKRGRWWQRWWARLVMVRRGSQAMPTALARLQGEEGCRLCAAGSEGEAYALRWLVRGCADIRFQQEYVASQGLCLPHLRRVLTEAAQADPDVARFLAADAVSRIEVLAADLAEYVRRHAWQHRHEGVTDPAADSPRQAAGFFGGSEGEA